MSILSNFSRIKNSNGTETLVEIQSGQAMHSRVGPWVEATALYAEPGVRYLTELTAFPKNSETQSQAPIVIYDVGMGIAANVLATLDQLCKIQNFNLRSNQIIFESFETKPEALTLALQEAKALRPIFQEFTRYSSQIETLLASNEVNFEIISQTQQTLQITWRLRHGDFFNFLSKEAQILPPDLIYYDFYAPQIFPALWGANAFSKIRAFLTNKNASPLLLTYASATRIRTALLLNQFYVGEGPSTTMKAQTTQAGLNLKALKTPLTASWLEKLARSSAPWPDDLSHAEANTSLSRLHEHPQFK